MGQNEDVSAVGLISWVNLNDLSVFSVHLHPNLLLEDTLKVSMFFLCPVSDT